ncbi:glycosyltransferase [Intrasporangium sp.]|jgi:glycosyltransferase involved in cell wall biosynthesis|uniref:glycosyltransferase n=1 Tax=Intrasporangium sp. TaxID=1925024 RepID=UPI0033654BAB
MEDRPRPPRPLHVAVVDHTAQLGGAELALVRLLEAIGDTVRVTVVLFEEGPLADRLRNSGRDVRVLALPTSVNAIRRDELGSSTALRSIGRIARHGFRLARLIRSLEVDVVHATSLKANLLTAALRPLIRRPLVWHVHDRIAPDYLPARTVKLVRRLARVPRVVVANSAATAATLSSRPDAIVAAPGLSPEQIRDSPRPRPSGPATIGVVGRISETKDQLTFVRAAAQVRDRNGAASFVVIGAPAFGADAYAEVVASEVSRLGLDEVVHFTGFVDDPTRLVDELTVAVHTAAVPEPFGQVVTEAMARGVPVIATSGGGVNEIFEHGSNSVGWLVPPASPDQLASAIVAALADPTEAERRAARGWEMVRARYPVSRTAELVRQAWSSAAASQRPARRRS